MLSHCPNTEMVAMIFDLRSRIPVFITREKNTATLLARTAEDHLEIAALLRERNGPALLALVRQHVLSGLKNI
jgi:DNA-binding GntR family transcriptional regulator